MSTIIIKNAAKEKAILETLKFFEARWPGVVKSWVDDMTAMKRVTNSTYKDQQGREYLVKMKVPSILFLALQHVIEDFGRDSDDIALLTRLCSDLNGVPKFKSRYAAHWAAQKKESPLHVHAHSEQASKAQG